jgi:hypothetical protein
MDIPSPPRRSIAQLQALIREYVMVMNQVKKKRDEVKTMSASLKSLTDEILQTMVDQNVPSCASLGYTFAVKEKPKMKSATAKVYLGLVKDYFKIPESAMTEFVQNIETRRREECEYLTTLECKAASSARRGAAPHPAAAAAAAAADAESSIGDGDGAGGGGSMSATLEDMYS